MENKLKQILSFCVLDKIKIIPLEEGKKAPLLKNWNSYQHIPFPTLKKDFHIHKNNYGLVCGQTSDGLFIIDCDTLDASVLIEELLKKHSIHTKVVKTSRGKHFYFKSPQNVIKTLKAEHIDIKAENSYVVGPYSQNHDNQILYLPENQNSIHILYPLGKDKIFIEELETILQKKLYIKTKTSYRLKERLTQTGIDKTTSEQELNIMIEMISKQYSKVEIFHKIKNQIHKESHLFKKTAQEQTEYLEYSYKKAFKIYMQNNYNENIRGKINYQATSIQLNIPTTSKKILITMLNIAEGKNHIKLSYREICKKASIGSLKTVVKHMEYLKKNEYITPIRPSEYKINYILISPKITTIPNTNSFRTLSLDIDSLLGKKSIPYLFSHGYLGSHVYFILCTILNHYGLKPFTLVSLFSSLSISRSSFYRCIQTMVSLGLLLSEKKQFTLSPQFLSILSSYSLAHNCDDKQKRKNLKIQLEREKYQSYQTLKLAFKRGHFSPDTWSKLQFSFDLFDLDYSLLLEIFAQDYKLQA